MIHAHDVGHPRHAVAPSPSRSGKIDCGGQMPITPPVCAISRAWSGEISRLRAPGRGAQRRVRQHQRLGGDRCGALHQVERSVRHIDNDAAAVAAADDLRAGIGQPAMLRRLGLDVAEFVHPVMGELQMAKLPAFIGLIDAVRLAFQEIAALGGDDRRRRAAARRLRAWRRW